MEIPHDESSEIAMIGCIASQPNLLDEFPVTAEYFYNYRTATLFKALHTLHVAGRVTSLHSIISTLPVGYIEQMGGIPAISRIIESVHHGSAPAIFDRLNQYVVIRRSLDVIRWAQSRLNSAMDSEEIAPFAQEFAKKASMVEISGDAENLLPEVTKAIRDRIDRMMAGGHKEGFQTFLPEWNRAFGGICEGQYIAIAGRPSVGKSAMLEQLVEDYLDAKKAVAVFEKDMSPQKMIERISCRKSGIPYRKFQRGLLSNEELSLICKWVDYIRSSGLIRLYAPQGLTAAKLCSIVRREIRQSKAECVFLDHITGLSVGKDFRQGLTMASLALRNNVTETGVPHIVLAHINREGGTGRPSPSNIKEFDQLYGDVDGMAILWSDKDMQDGEKQINFYVAKNREGGETQESLTFNGPLMKFLA